MNLLNLYTKIYGSLYNRVGIHYLFFSPIRFLVRKIANISLPYFLSKPCAHSSQRIPDLIISFTSFPARIKNVWMVVESIKRQSYLPEKIILWLSDEQFRSYEELPDKLKEEEDSLFEIKFVPNDLRSHKKYMYAFLQFPKKTIITIDDDIFYHPDTIKFLVDGNRTYPNNIIANCTKKILYNDDEIMPYNLWEQRRIKIFESEDLVQIGVGGVLYPPQLLDKIVVDDNLFMSLAPTADDLWLNSIARYSNVKIVQSGLKILFLPIESKTPSLSSSNKYEGKNDEQLGNINSYMKEHMNINLYHTK